MYKRLLFIMIASVIAGMIFWSCSDDGGSTNPPATPSVKILSPNGGDILQMGQTVWVHFENDLTEAVAIHVYKGQDSIDVVDPMITVADSIQWLIPSGYDEGFDYRLKIVSTEDPAKYDFSDANFIIAPANDYIMVTSPNGGGIWLKGSVTTINWITNIAGTVRIDLYKNGIAEQVIYNSQINDGSQGWTIPGTLDDGADYTIKVQSIETPAVEDYSDNFFCLATNDNTQNVIGDWNINYFWKAGPFSIDFHQDKTCTIVEGDTLTGTWNMTGNGLRFDFDDWNTYYLGVVDGNNMTGTMLNDSGTNDGTWNGVRIIPELLTPNGGEVWMHGTTQTITWNPAIAGNVVLSLADSTGVVQTIATVSGDLGTYDWSIPSNVEPGSAYLIRIHKEINAEAMDESDAYICISNSDEIDITGEWKIYSTVTKWSAIWTFNSDYTWTNTEALSGTWQMSGNGLRWDYDSFPTYYIGNIGIDVGTGTSLSTTMGWNAERILEVVTPNGGGLYNAGVVVPITWYETITAENVTIDLYENDVFNRNIGTVNVNTTPSYNWTVPADLTTSTKYKIRMTSTTSDIYDESDDYFTVVAVPATPAVEDETFDDGIAQNWGVVTGNWTLADSLYKSDNVTAPTSIYTSTTVLNTEITGNYQVEVKARKVSGNFYYGILLNGDSTNVDVQGMWNSIQFMVDVDGTGQYYLAYYSNGTWMSTSHATPPALNTGLNVWNTLKVIVNNDTNEYHLFINDQYIGTVVDTHYNHGLVGLYDYNTIPSETEFDYIRITPVNKSAMDGINIKILEPSEPVEMGIRK